MFPRCVNIAARERGDVSHLSGAQHLALFLSSENKYLRGLWLLQSEGVDLHWAGHFVLWGQWSSTTKCPDRIKFESAALPCFDRDALASAALKSS